MRLSISNIAWDVGLDSEVAALLNAYGVNAIDIAPGKYFNAANCNVQQRGAEIRNWWADLGIELVGMQALLFGTQGLNMFGAPDVQDAMLEHLDYICAIGAATGARKLAFGSPRNRDRSGLSDAQSMDMAVPFFRKLADRAEAHDVIVCLEPNPPVYDCNFMTTTREAIAVVQAVDHPNIRLQIDTGAMITNQEDAAQVVAEAINWFGHIHLSEPNLAPLGESGSNHTAIENTLKLLVPEATATIEMRQTREGANSLVAVSSALDYARKHYSLVGHS